MTKAKNQKPKVDLHINDIAKLANLKLNPQEQESFQKQLSEILEYVQSLDTLDTSKVEPIGQITGLSNIKRDDKARLSLSQDDALSNTKRTYDNFVEVEAILEEQ